MKAQQLLFKSEKKLKLYIIKEAAKLGMIFKKDNVNIINVDDVIKDKIKAPRHIWINSDVYELKKLLEFYNWKNEDAAIAFHNQHPNVDLYKCQVKAYWMTRQAGKYIHKRKSKQLI